MRLSIFSLDHMRPLQSIKLRLFRRVAGIIPSPFWALSYRRELFGKQFAPVINASLRGKSEWAVSDLELFAAFVSQLNACTY